MTSGGVLRFDFTTCFEVDDEVIAKALQPARSLTDATPRDKLLGLLRRMAEVSAPRQGASRMLLVLGRMAACAWLEGKLDVRLKREGEGTRVEVLVNDGLSLSRLHPPFIFHTPLAEFQQLVQKRAVALLPLVVGRGSESEMYLVTKASFDESGGNEAGAMFESRGSSQKPPVPDFLQKTTVKMQAVRLPKEAYRDDVPTPGAAGAPVTGKEPGKDSK